MQVATRLELSPHQSFPQTLGHSTTTRTICTLVKMAANIPAGLKTADVVQYASRAAQLEKFKPVIAYWCLFICLIRNINVLTD